MGAVKLAAFCALGVWALLYLVPLALVFLSGDALHALISPAVLPAVRATLWQASWSAGLSLLIGLPLGLWVGAEMQRSAQFSASARGFLNLPWAVPALVASSAWVAWLGGSGILARLGIETEWMYSFRAVVLAHVFFNAPFVAISVAESRAQIPESRLEFARSLGAGQFAVFRFVTWPGVRFAAFASTLQSFTLCCMSFSLVLLLGGGPPNQTIEVALYGALRNASLELGRAQGLALWQVFLTAIPWGILLWLEARRPAAEGRIEMRLERGRHFRRGFLLLLSLAFVFPYLVTLVRFPELQWSMAVVTALGDSVLLALLSAVVTVVVASVGILSVRALQGSLQTVWKFLLVLPAGVSILALAWGLWTAYPRVFRLSGAGLEVLVFLQLAVFLPLVVRSGIVHLRGVQESLLETARSLGASPWRAFFTVEWPRWRPWVWTMLAWIAGGSVAEIAALSLFRVDGFEPLPILVLRELGRYGFSQGEALSGLLLLVAFVLSFGSSAWSVKRT